MVNNDDIKLLYNFIIDFIEYERQERDLLGCEKQQTNAWTQDCP